MHPPRLRLLVTLVVAAALGVVTLALPGGHVPASAASAALPANSAVDPVGVWPLQPRPKVIRAFEPPPDPYGAGHRGVDLAGGEGQVVHAALPGRVTFAAPLAGRGVVVVDHGATRTTYEPVTATVRVGDEVTAGAPIGLLTSIQSHCLPRTCLHWGWIEGETYLDPLKLVGLGPVRLLPLWRETPAALSDTAPPTLWSPYRAWRPAVLPVTPEDEPADTHVAGGRSSRGCTTEWLPGRRDPAVPGRT